MSEAAKKYRYRTIGNNRYRCWDELFKDEDTGELVSIKRHRLIKIDNKRVYWNPTRRRL